MNRKQRRAQGQKKGKAGRPPDPAALHEAGIEAFAAGRLPIAADLIGQAIAADGAVPEFHYNRAIVLKAMGLLAEAAISYERAIALKPDYVNAHNNLGNIWKALGRTDKARASFTEALKLNPANADTHYSLGMLCCDLVQPAEAERHFRDCLAADPDDRHGAKILLAHLGAGDVPGRTPQAQLQSLYQTRARFWDQESSYFGARLVAEAFRRHATPGVQDILDIGCGTGLVGAQLPDLAARLEGVDVSAAMLEKARAKNLYRDLFQADLVAFLAARQASYDALLGAATLIHFGDLKPLFAAASRSLRDRGLFIFTLFPHAGEADYTAAASQRLAQSGCFAHSVAYVERLARETGFARLEMEAIVHEHDQDDRPVAGVLAVLRKS